MRPACGMLLILAGCGGLPKVDSNILKISYFRSMEDSKTKKNVPLYRVVMSTSWEAAYGNSPREPYPRAADRNVYKGIISDEDMREYVGTLKEKGLDTMEWREPESVNTAQLKRLASNKNTVMSARVITVGSDKGHRSYLVTDQVRSDQSEAFLRCEKFVMRVVEYSFQFRTGVEPFNPRQR